MPQPVLVNASQPAFFALPLPAPAPLVRGCSVLPGAVLMARQIFISVTAPGSGWTLYAGPWCAAGPVSYSVYNISAANQTLVLSLPAALVSLATALCALPGSSLLLLMAAPAPAQTPGPLSVL